jgi:hypothetical protein
MPSAPGVREAPGPAGGGTVIEERQDIYSGRSIEWRWVLVGALIVMGLESLTGAALDALGLSIQSFSFLLGTTSVGFLLGGIVIGWMSPGYTQWEAGFASVLAAGGTAFVAIRLFGEGFVAGIPIGLGWGLVCGLIGGKLGEMLQAREGRRG